MKPDDDVLRITVKDLQSVARNFKGRELTETEVKHLTSNMNDTKHVMHMIMAEISLLELQGLMEK